MRNYKAWFIALSTFGLVIFFQNCAQDFDPELLNAGRDDLGSEINPDPPEIFANSESITVGVGEPLTVSFASSGSGLFYKWYKDDEPFIGGPQASLLEIAAAEVEHSGIYRLCAENQYGEDCKSILVEVIELVTSGPPEIISHSGFLVEDTYFVYVLGNLISLQVTANGENLNYQWYFRASNRNTFIALNGATNAQHTVSSANNNNSGTYRVTVSNSGGSQSVEIEVVVIDLSGINIGF